MSSFAGVPIRVNGKERILEEGRTVASLLEDLGQDSRLVAVECNGRILRREEFGSHRLYEGDRLEIVRFVQGG
jgi:thiamine biosynthesis protein ThiS